MSENGSDQPDRPPTARFLAALDVRRNATIGIAVGTVFAATTFVFFVVLGPPTVHSPLLYVGLALVLAAAVTGMVATALTIRSALELRGELAEDDLR